MKNLKKLGKNLNKKEQQAINGGSGRCWDTVCFPSEGKCNHYCGGTCTPCGLPTPQGFTPHVCSEPCS